MRISMTAGSQGEAKDGLTSTEISMDEGGSRKKTQPSKKSLLGSQGISTLKFRPINRVLEQNIYKCTVVFAQISACRHAECLYSRLENFQLIS